MKLVGNASKLGYMAANIDETGVIGFMAGWRPQRELVDTAQFRVIQSA